MKISRQLSSEVANTLKEIVPLNINDPIYSLGFQKWQKLSLAKKKSIMIINEFNYSKCIEMLSK